MAKLEGSKLEIKANRLGRGKIFLNGHELPGVMSIDTRKLIERDNVSTVTLTILVDEFILTCTDGEDGPRG